MAPYFFGVIYACITANGRCSILVRELLTGVNDDCITEFLRVVDQLLPVKSFYKICPELHRHTFRHAGAQPSGQYRSGWRKTRPVLLNSGHGAWI